VSGGSERGPQFIPSVSQFDTFFTTSVRLSLATRSVSTSGRRLISPSPDPLNSRDAIPVGLMVNQVLGPRSATEGLELIV